MQEMSTLQAASVHNQVYHLQKPDYSTEVTDASQKTWVLVLLTSSSGTNPESQRLIEIWRQLATKYGELKFCQMRAGLCIEGYPDRSTPTVLIYKDGEIRRQIVTLRELKGERTALEDVEAVLVQLGAVKVGDFRLRKKEEEDEEQGSGRRGIKQSQRGRKDDEDDSDWD
jgi:hypothetical protein